MWGRFGFVDGFSEQRGWYADTFLAISQGPIVVMIENYRSGLLWKLFIGIPEIQAGMRKLGFRSPHWA
ncbi:MAG: glucoamylase family protein [Roseiarcus sp.]